MNAKIQEQPANHLDETIDFLHIDSGSDKPEGSHDMPRTTPQGQHRYTFSSGARPLEGYTIKRAVGRGGFGEVYYATSDSGKEVALKLITRNLEIERRGVAQCMNLKCPNLLAIHDIKTNDTGDTFVIMEFVAGPSLSSVLAQYPDGMPEAEIRAWLKGLVEGVAYLHDHGIVHRDLKPANLFMEEGVVKIGDYGLSKMISSEHASNHSESVGTCHYMAPEIRNGKYHKPIDIYAMGVILFEMITGRVPFEGETAAEVLLKHLTNRPDLSKLKEPYKSIVGQALAKDPAHRQSSVLALLPPDDAQRPRDVRFIGEGKIASPAPSPRAKTPDDDILRITDEEPVLYIGPDTKPPRGKAASYNPWTRRSPQPSPARRPAPARPAASPARSGQRVRLIATSPLIPPEPPPSPQPLPHGRIRLAELAASMLWAAPWAALLSLVVGALMHVDLTARPQDLGYLFAMTLAGTWTVLVANKAVEAKQTDATARRVGQLILGVLLGLLGQFLASWMIVDPVAPAETSLRFVWFNQSVPAHSLPGFLGYAAYFGLVGLAVDWWTMTDRDRKSRFRLVPILKAGLLALIPSLLFFQPDTHPFTLPAVVLTSVVVQLASPWSEAGARYAAYARANKINARSKVA